jgi:hypothetical protein
VDELPADPSSPAASVTVHAVARQPDLAELLHIDMQELARLATLIAVRWLERLQARALAETDPREHGRDR